MSGAPHHTSFHSGAHVLDGFFDLHEVWICFDVLVVSWLFDVVGYVLLSMSPACLIMWYSSDLPGPL